MAEILDDALALGLPVHTDARETLEKLVRLKTFFKGQVAFEIKGESFASRAALDALQQGLDALFLRVGRLVIVQDETHSAPPTTQSFTTHSSTSPTDGAGVSYPPPHPVPTHSPRQLQYLSAIAPTSAQSFTARLSSSSMDSAGLSYATLPAHPSQQLPYLTAIAPPPAQSFMAHSSSSSMGGAGVLYSTPPAEQLRFLTAMANTGTFYQSAQSTMPAMPVDVARVPSSGFGSGVSIPTEAVPSPGASVPYAWAVRDASSVSGASTVPGASVPTSIEQGVSTTTNSHSKVLASASSHSGVSVSASSHAGDIPSAPSSHAQSYSEADELPPMPAKWPLAIEVGYGMIIDRLRRDIVLDKPFGLDLSETTHLYGLEMHQILTRTRPDLQSSLEEWNLWIPELALQVFLSVREFRQTLKATTRGIMHNTHVIETPAQGENGTPLSPQEQQAVVLSHIRAGRFVDLVDDSVLLPFRNPVLSCVILALGCKGVKHGLYAWKDIPPTLVALACTVMHSILEDQALQVDPEDDESDALASDHLLERFTWFQDAYQQCRAHPLYGRGVSVHMEYLANDLRACKDGEYWKLASWVHLQDQIRGANP
uniref:Uncharacterized protein n=1 Tax=Mycena chlorophos TaxID=658473 RepID=A0ABQ0L9C0_MYCCL|nr:predicted protein [Mycena chlorophos]